MKVFALISILAVSIRFPGPVNAADSPKPEPPAESIHGPALNDAEAKFKELLTNATLHGRWCSIKDATLGQDKEDSYTIVSIGKVKGDSWVVNARMKYGEREFVAPIPVQVKWAG